jgi:uncharacterized membrane protein YeaQ/YmgE (transglycosylase-associated protein family)
MVVGAIGACIGGVLVSAVGVSEPGAKGPLAMLVLAKSS